MYDSKQLIPFLFKLPGSAFADSNVQKIIHLECYCLAVSLKIGKEVR